MYVLSCCHCFPHISPTLRILLLCVKFKVQTCVLLPVSKCSLGNCANSVQERQLQRLIGRILASLCALGGADRMPERNKKVWRATTVFKSVDSVLAQCWPSLEIGLLGEFQSGFTERAILRAPTVSLAVLKGTAITLIKVLELQAKQ